jgi:hypothetical protein
MNTKPLRHRAATRSTANVEKKKVRVGKVPVPSAKLVASRLATLTAASTPWFRQDVDLTPPDGGQEVCGPEAYQAPKPRS